jgi:hypothetical protein
VARILYILLLLPFAAQAQRDSVYFDTATSRKVMTYQLKDQTLFYPKSKPYDFIIKIPKTFGGATRMAFKKESLGAWAAIAGSTAALILADQQLVNKVQQFSRYINLDNNTIYGKPLEFDIGSQHLLVYRAPGNLTTFLYQLGEGIPPILLAGGILTYGLIKKDYRAQSTASQVMQALITMGITTQAVKRISGRESPFRSTTSGGRWSPLPSFSTYKNNVSRFDAFSSGHMGTMMTSFVVIAENYPEKKWIRPVGYSIMTLVGLTMMNTGVHWAGDYPLALGLGYVCGKTTVELNRWVKRKY